MTRKTARRRIPLLMVAALVAFTGLSTVQAQSPRRGMNRARANQRRSPVIVRARAGETLASLSARFNVSVADLSHANNLGADARLQTGQQIIVPIGSSSSVTPEAVPAQAAPSVVSISSAQASDVNRLRLTDGSTVEFDETWEDSRGIWYRRGGLVSLVARDRVAAIERRSEGKREESAKPAERAKVVEVSAEQGKAKEPVWIYLVGGARVEADEVAETDTGAWYRRGGLSIFLERARIERIERERPAVSDEAAASPAGSWVARGWTTGNQRLDQMIRAGGERFGVDPYLIFCVMEQESRFNSRAVSPKGARGLMQLMPGTAARFGVRDSFDPQQNIMGGTMYLKQLLEQFNGRVDLVLASYNAGEGAVMKYGGNVPPYRETRDYVRRIGARYGQTSSLVQKTAMTRLAP